VEQASQAFDDITYQKGQAVIRMLESYVGADAWRDGVRAYIAAHAYGNTVSDDLWRKIELAAAKPVRAIAHDFTLQPGVPMIRVEDAVCKDGSSTVALTQGEFSRDRPHKAPLAWRVPVIAQGLGSTVQVRTLVAGGKASLTVPGCAPVLVNAGQSGYYRTLYAPKAFAAIAARFGTLATIDQLGVLSDSWSLGLAGLQPVSDFLGLALAIPIEADPQVWGKVADVFGAINEHYQPSPKRQREFSRFAISRLAPVMTQVGWAARAGEPEPVANLREKLIDTLSDLGDPAVIAEARRRYGAQARDPSAVPGALRKAILGVVARHADGATWDRLRAAANAEPTPLIKSQMYDVLASSADEALARRALALALTPEPGATNSAAMIARVAEAHPDLAFNYALQNIKQVNERIDATSRSRYFPRLASGSASPATIGLLNAYAKANLAQGSRRDADTAVAGINDRIMVRAERLPAIDAWLAANRH
jgi:aminopeptidase N